MRLINKAHWALFCLFLATAIAALAVFIVTGNLAQAGFIAGASAFFATASTFLERLFPKGE